MKLSTIRRVASKHVGSGKDLTQMLRKAPRVANQSQVG